MKKIYILSFFVMLLISLIAVNFISSQEISYCCEKVIDGPWCVSAPEDDCDSKYRKKPTSCESTYYCKKGCCYDSQEGNCAENTPEKVCDEGGGVWEESATCDIPQCEKGCCLIGNQAAFVSQTSCKRLSSVYGLEIDFRTDIQNEIECISSAKSEVIGACVFEKEFEKTCLSLPQKECLEMPTGENSQVNFYEGILCSDESLATNCGPSEKTTCVEGKDGVYFLDTCGNIANIYDSTKIKNKNYWSEIIDVGDSCSPDSSNANSETCGNCDYFLGSTCKSYVRGEDKKPVKGNNICRKLDCEDENFNKIHNRQPKHGETWCATNSKKGNENNPGSRDFRLVCYNGEVSVEPCADFRQEVCIESAIGEDDNAFTTAACRVNMWQDCAAQETQKDCENTDRRDCRWIGDVKHQLIKCVSKNTPGFNFWETDSNSEAICATANTECVVTYEKKLGQSWNPVENQECLTKTWNNSMNDFCVSLGDCGSQTNYLGAKGYNDNGASYSGINKEEEKNNSESNE